MCLSPFSDLLQGLRDFRGRGRSGDRTVTCCCLTLRGNSLAGFLGNMGASRLIRRRCRFRQYFEIAWTTQLLPMWVRPGRNRTLHPKTLSLRRLSWTFFRSGWFPALTSWWTRHHPRFADHYRGRSVDTVTDLPKCLTGRVSHRSPGLVPRWRLAREGPFLRGNVRSHQYVVWVLDAHFATRPTVLRTMRRCLASLAFHCTIPDSWNGLAYRSRRACWKWDQGGGCIRCLGTRLWMRLSSSIGMFV